MTAAKGINSLMKTRRECLFAGVAGLAVGPSAMAAETADLILHGGQVLTVDDAFSIRSAVAVKDGKILAVGGPEILQRYAAAQTIDLKGRTLAPGFTDTHVHLRTLPRRAIRMDDVNSIAQIKDRIRQKAAELGPGEWITGRGWSEYDLAEKRRPLRADLDEAAPNNPVALTRAGSHSIVGNSAALKIAGITKGSAQPDAGLIEFDDDGEPNGVIRERNDLYADHIPGDTWADTRQGYIDNLKSLLELGVTTVFTPSHIDDEPADRGGAQPSTGAFRRGGDGAQPTGTFSWRGARDIYGAMGADLPRCTLYISYPGAARLKAFPHRSGHGDERLRLGAIGESGIDGGFTGPTAWTLQDYKGMPGFRGAAMRTAAQTQEMVDTCAALGWQMGVHTIGDAAIQMGVDAYVNRLRQMPPGDYRWYLCHLTMNPPERTLDLMAQYRIGAAIQPNFLYNLEGRYTDTLDGARLEKVNPIAGPLKKGVFLAFGSDNLPVGPMVALYAAITRKGMSGRVYGPEEAISRQDAIRLHTRAPAYLTFEEKLKGVIAPGMLADLIVLPEDPLTVDPERLLRMPVDMTIVGGKVLFDRARPLPDIPRPDRLRISA